MNLPQLFTDASIGRVLFIDDDLRQYPTSAEVDASSDAHQRVSEILRSVDSEDYEQYIAVLAANNIEGRSLDALFNALRKPAVLNAAPESIREPYKRAAERIAGQGASVREIMKWVTGWTGVVPDVKTGPIDNLRAPDHLYDLLVIDYFLVEDSPDKTLPFVKKFLELHKDQPNPVLIILMTSNGDALRKDLDKVKQALPVSSARFRILEKPHADLSRGSLVALQRWTQAVTQLATQRALVLPMEELVSAWKKSLEDAAKVMQLKLLDLDASAFAVLEHTAVGDSMGIEEYLAELLSRKVAAEAEENALVHEKVKVLQEAMASQRHRIEPMITRGVELRHAQMGIRSLMADVVWHRRPWWEHPAIPVVPPAPQEAAEETDAVATEGLEVLAQDDVAGDAASAQGEAVVEAPNVVTAAAETAEHVAAGELAIVRTAVQDEESQRRKRAVTDERLQWLKRHVRFGTVLQDKLDRSRFLLNITQACDIQQVKTSQAGDNNFLFVRGTMSPLETHFVGDKLIKSPYFRNVEMDDEFSAFHWNLRQPYTPTIGAYLGEAENYEVVGQLRHESAYKVLAKFASQATRVAEIAMPRFYRWPVHIYQRSRAKLWERLGADKDFSASAWQIADGEWRVQFSIDEAADALDLARDLNNKAAPADGEKPLSDTDRGALMGALLGGVVMKKKAEKLGNGIATVLRFTTTGAADEPLPGNYLQEKVPADKQTKGHIALVLLAAN